MKARCGDCRTLIEFGQGLCDKCKSKRNKENKDNLKDKTAEKHTKTSRWQKVRKQIIIRDNGVCQLCFARGFIENRRLQVHHMVKRTTDLSLAYEPTNLVTVCPPCHEELECLSVTKQKELLKMDKPKTIDFTL